MPVPATVASFLQELLQRAVQSPLAENIRPIYSILSGVGFNVLDVLPLEVVDRFQSQLLKILKSLEAEDHSANLICLAILANVASRDNTDSMTPRVSAMPDHTSSSNEDVAEIRDRYHTARQFFTAKRASKTLDLVVLKVILSCSRNCSLRVDGVLESLKLSEEIVDAVPSRERSAWVKSNAAKVKKLSEKILRPDIDKEVKCVVSYLNQLP